jgi:hypothetical protein
MERLFIDPDVAAVFMLFAVPLIAIIGDCWWRLFRFCSNQDLKRAMIKRGMNAQEITQVINAGR